MAALPLKLTPLEAPCASVVPDVPPPPPIDWATRPLASAPEVVTVPLLLLVTVTVPPVCPVPPLPPMARLRLADPVACVPLTVVLATPPPPPMDCASTPSAELPVVWMAELFTTVVVPPMPPLAPDPPSETPTW